MLGPGESAGLKACCARLYAAPWVKLLLGGELHPGGRALTEELGQLLDLDRGHLVLDVAGGDGSSARILAASFGCRVIGADLSGVPTGCPLVRADGERLPFASERFDAVVCECGFCLFPDKAAAAAEFARVLRPGGWVGIADVTRRDHLPGIMSGLEGWVSCVEGARPAQGYADLLEGAGIRVHKVLPKPEPLQAFIGRVAARLAVARLLAKLGKLPFAEADVVRAVDLARRAARAAEEGTLGYALIIGQKELPA